jgi:hypothetical protein
MWIVAALCLVSAFTVIGKPDSAAGLIGCFVVAAVFGFLGYRNFTKYKAFAARQAATASESAARDAERQARLDARGFIETSVAGVTFKNDDKTSRQQLIKSFMQADEIGETLSISLIPYEYDGAPAISVEINDKCIGNIKKDDVSRIMAVKDRIESIGARFDTLKSEGGGKVFYVVLRICYLKES